MTPAIVGYRKSSLIALLTLSLACAAAGAPRGPATGDASDIGSRTDGTTVGAGEPGVTEPAEPRTGRGGPTEPQPQRGPSTAQQRTESGVEGLIVGTVIGGQLAGPAGAAVGAAVFGSAGSVTLVHDDRVGERGPRAPPGTSHRGGTRQPHHGCHRL